MDHRFYRRLRVLVPLALALALAGSAAGPAGASQPEDCPKWFPDFRCDRSGRYEGFQMPIFAPFMFEDPFITTGLYPWYIWHGFPNGSALGGGHAQAVALQARIALTDRLAFIAPKDGFVVEEPGSPILRDQNGFLNIAAGLKYALIDAPERNFILSSILRVEVKTGANDIFDGGSGLIFIPSLSAAWGRDRLHVMGDVGGHVPSNGDENSGLVFYHLYVDYAVTPRFQPFIQLSGISYVDPGDGSRIIRTRVGQLPVAAVEGLVGSFEGMDLHNLGSSGVDDNDFLALGIGAHIPLTKHVTFSFGYERPVTERKDLFRDRVTTNLRIEF